MPKKEKKAKPQHQKKQPGVESKMKPQPESKAKEYRPAGKLLNKVALITGGDSGIGRAVAIMFAKEGADVALVFKANQEKKDALETQKLVENEGRECLVIQADISDENLCNQIVKKTLSKFKKLNILVNNAAVQFYQESIENITKDQLFKTFETNIFAMFYLSKEALKHMEKGDCIVNTTSITAYKGNKDLLDYSSTKGAIVTFTRSLASQLAEKGIRVNAVAPGPIWTPLIPSSFPAKKVGKFGEDTPLGRMGQPDEVAPCYVFLASDDASFITGQVLHPNGGSIING